MLDKLINHPLQVFKIHLEHQLTYTSDLYNYIPDVLNNADFLLIYSAKDTGKSTIGYQKLARTIQAHQDAVYARLQAKEKETALLDLIVHLRNTYNLDFQKIRGFGSDNFYLNGDTKAPRIKFASMGDYQSLRSTINPNTGLIFFDEINADAFPPNFLEKFINAVSTLTRSAHIQFYGCGNNETAQNNPMLAMLQIALDWRYKYLQIAVRIVSGLICVVIQVRRRMF